LEAEPSDIGKVKLWQSAKSSPTRYQQNHQQTFTI
jgi:hypothetical protein